MSARSNLTLGLEAMKSEYGHEQDYILTSDAAFSVNGKQHIWHEVRDSGKGDGCKAGRLP